MADNEKVACEYRNRKLSQRLEAVSAPTIHSSPSPPFLRQNLSRTLGSKGIAGPWALLLKRNGAVGHVGHVAELDHAMHLTKAAAAVVSALGRHVLGLGTHLVHNDLGAILALVPRRLGAPELGNEAVKSVGHIIVIANGHESLFVIVAPRTPVHRSLVEAGPAGRLAESDEGLQGKREK